ncbi:MAG: hypothetical protein V1911_03725, partial [Candidatus Micrarchaeota archaeon]
MGMKGIARLFSKKGRLEKKAEKLPTQYVRLFEEAKKTGDIAKMKEVLTAVKSGKLKIKSIPIPNLIFSATTNAGLVKIAGLKRTIPNVHKRTMRGGGIFFWGPESIDKKYLVKLKGEEEHKKFWHRGDTTSALKSTAKHLDERMYPLNPLNKSAQYVTAKRMRDFKFGSFGILSNPGVIAVDLEKMYKRGYRIAIDPEIGRGSYIVTDKEGYSVENLNPKHFEFVADVDAEKIKEIETAAKREVEEEGNLPPEKKPQKRYRTPDGRIPVIHA